MTPSTCSLASQPHPRYRSPEIGSASRDRLLRDGSTTQAACSKKPPQPAAISYRGRPPHGARTRGGFLRQRGGAGGERGRVCGEENPRGPD